MLEIKKVLMFSLLGLSTAAMGCGDDGGAGDGDGCPGHEICLPDASPFVPDADPGSNLIVRTGTLRDLSDDAHPAIAGNDVTYTIDPDNDLVKVDAFTASGFNEDEIVTLWWVHFHEVDKCENPDQSIFSLCSVPDLLMPADTVTIIPAFGYAGPCPMGGARADASGVVSFPELASPLIAADAAQDPDWLLGSNGLRLLNAETHVVLRSHGPAIDDDQDLLDSQFCTAKGGYNAGEPHEARTDTGNRQVVVFNPPE